MYRILNELAEILQEKDIEASLDLITSYNKDEIDVHVLNFIKSLG